MVNMNFKIEDRTLIIEKYSFRKKEIEKEKYKLSFLEIGKEYKTNFKVTETAMKNKIFEK